MIAALTSIALSLLTMWGVYNFVPWSTVETLSWRNFIGQTREEKVGATITTINATDLISDSRATINTNFSNLNSDKIEVASTSIGNITSLPGLTTAGSLVTVGTLTSGGLGAGFTNISVARGGTGSTTLAAYHVLVGSSTNAIGTALGLGTSGQFLTSQGASAPPNWTTSAIDQAGTYAWTGYHSWTANTNNTGNAYFQDLNASSSAANPILLNGIDYAFPASEGASSTVLSTNGTGSLIWRTLNYDSGTFILNDSTTGAVAYNHYLGRIPSFIRLTTYGTTTGGGAPGVADFFESVGNATSTASQRAIYKYIALDDDNGSNDDAVTEINATSTRIVALVYEGSGGGACSTGVELLGRLTGLTDLTFTITWDSNCNQTENQNRFIMWEVW